MVTNIIGYNSMYPQEILFLLELIRLIIISNLCSLELRRKCSVTERV